MTLGFRIKTTWTRIDLDLVVAFRTLPVANVSDAMSRLSAFGQHMRPMHRKGVLAGPALTVRTRPGDNLLLHKAIDMAQPGDVIVVDAGGDLTNSLMGELMLTHAVQRGVAGFVLNGAIRDAEEISRQDVPVYASGVTHRGPYKNGPGELGFPISIGGIVVAPGDLILGDYDGVVAISPEDAPSVLGAARSKHAAEKKQMAATKAGTLDRSWVDKALIEGGCEFCD